MGHGDGEVTSMDLVSEKNKEENIHCEVASRANNLSLCRLFKSFYANNMQREKTKNSLRTF